MVKWWICVICCILYYFLALKTDWFHLQKVEASPSGPHQCWHQTVWTISHLWRWVELTAQRHLGGHSNLHKMPTIITCQLWQIVQWKNIILKFITWAKHTQGKHLIYITKTIPSLQDSEDTMAGWHGCHSACLRNHSCTPTAYQLLKVCFYPCPSVEKSKYLRKPALT